MNCFKKFIIVLSIFSIGCNNDYTFPNTQVNIAIPITMPQYNNVYNNIWGYEYLNGGLGGIIIVKSLNNEFIAYDRSCTFELNSDCIVSGSNLNDPILTCTDCCNSKFIINDGSVTDGEANQALKRYNTYFNITKIIFHYSVPLFLFLK